MPGRPPWKPEHWELWKRYTKTHPAVDMATRDAPLDVPHKADASQPRGTILLVSSGISTSGICFWYSNSMLPIYINSRLPRAPEYMVIVWTSYLRGWPFWRVEAVSQTLVFEMLSTPQGGKLWWRCLALPGRWFKGCASAVGSSQSSDDLFLMFKTLKASVPICVHAPWALGKSTDLKMLTGVVTINKAISGFHNFPLVELHRLIRQEWTGAAAPPGERGYAWLRMQWLGLCPTASESSQF